MEESQSFLYFAYGSNLLKERLQLQNPSAIVHCVARLKVSSTRLRPRCCFVFRLIRIFNLSGLQTGLWELQRPGQ